LIKVESRVKPEKEKITKKGPPSAVKLIQGPLGARVIKHHLNYTSDLIFS
jgi:hypothetical protein